MGEERELSYMHPGQMMRNRHELAERTGSIEVKRHGRTVGSAERTGCRGLWRCELSDGTPAGQAGSASSAERNVVAAAKRRESR